MIGMGSAATPAVLRRELAELGGDIGPFGIGLVHWVLSEQPDLLEVALSARPALLSVSFGEDTGASAATGNGPAWVQDAHDAGVITATQVATVEEAVRAVESGVDVLVARGAEGAGTANPCWAPCRC